MTSMSTRSGMQQERQTAFILCDNDRGALQALTDEIVEKQLDAATILLYGVTTKQRDGFIVVDAARGVPVAFTHWLQQDQRILDYVVYDDVVPRPQQERQAEEAEAQMQEDQQPQIPAGVQRAIQELEQWLTRHRYRLIPDDETGGLRLVPDDDSQEGAQA